MQIRYSHCSNHTTVGRILTLGRAALLMPIYGDAVLLSSPCFLTSHYMERHHQFTRPGYSSNSAQFVRLDQLFDRCYLKSTCNTTKFDEMARPSVLLFLLTYLQYTVQYTHVTKQNISLGRTLLFTWFQLLIKVC